MIRKILSYAVAWTVSMLASYVLFAQEADQAFDKARDDAGQATAFGCFIGRTELTTRYVCAQNYMTGARSNEINATFVVSLYIRSTRYKIEDLVTTRYSASVHRTKAHAAEHARKAPELFALVYQDGEQHDAQPCDLFAYWQHVSQYYGNMKEPNDLLGVFATQIKCIDPDAVSLQRLTGSAFLPVIKEKGEMTLKPLAEHAGKPIMLSNGARIEIEKLDQVPPATIRYTLDPDDERLLGAEITFFDADGQNLQKCGGSSSYRGDVQICSYTYLGVPEDAYAVITYPTRIEVVEIPFDFTDVPISGIVDDEIDRLR